MEASVWATSGNGILKQPMGVINVLPLMKTAGQRHHKVRGVLLPCKAGNAPTCSTKLIHRMCDLRKFIKGCPQLLANVLK